MGLNLALDLNPLITFLSLLVGMVRMYGRRHCLPFGDGSRYENI